jgi:S-formylglutathione hydrolase FrmB
MLSTARTDSQVVTLPDVDSADAALPDGASLDAALADGAVTDGASPRFIGHLLWVVLSVGQPLAAADWQFDVQFAETARAEPYSGRVYLFFGTSDQPEPRQGLNWFSPQPFASVLVANWPPGESLRIAAGNPEVQAFPRPLNEVALGKLHVQAVARFNDWERAVGSGPGNGYSAVMTLPEHPPEEPLRLTIDRLIPPREFHETPWSKRLAVRSARLSAFHGRDVEVQAAVLLPKSYYDQPTRRYPTIYQIPGFGGTLFLGRREEPIEEHNPGNVEFLRVTLDPNCPWGHHVFADSETNGPWGTALVAEWLPEYERQFRSVQAAHGRLLTGHSSGGWSSLWLQITSPETFGGVWSTAPDSVDFRDFQQINIYRAGENAYRDPAGNRRPIARRGKQVAIWLDDFDRMEQVLGHGGQFESFEAVFSPRGTNGRPMPLWDRRSGALDAAVARAWERYDIRLVLERNWQTLGPRLAGKLHIFMGESDTFYLEGAVRLLKDALQRLGSDAVIEIHPGKDHGSLLTPELRDRIRREMAETFLRGENR